MTYQEIIEIEKKYPINSIRVNNISIWMIVRNILFNIVKTSEIRKNIEYKDEKSVVEKNFEILNLENNKNKNLMFTSSINRRLYNNKYLDPILDPIADYLGQNSSIFLEDLQEFTLYSKNVFDYNTLLKSKIDSELFDFKIENEELLLKTFKILGIKFDYKNKLRNFFKYYFSIKKILNELQPKTIFIDGYIGKLNIILAARELNIPVIEVQHGSIIGHFAYDTNFEIESLFKPNYFLVFSQLDKEYLSNKSMYENKNIFIQGNYHLDFLNKKIEKIEAFRTLKKTFSKIVSISSQDTVELKLIEFIKDVAKINTRILFILIPRTNKEEIEYTRNFYTMPEFNCYEILLNSDIHTTVYSTCAYESLVFGKPTILINIENYSTMYYDYFKKLDYLKIVNNKEDYTLLINKKNIGTKKLSFVNYKESLEKNINYILKEFR